MRRRDPFRFALFLQVRDLGHHHRADGGDKPAQAVDDLFRVFIQAVLVLARNVEHHDLVHPAINAHRHHRNEQHRAGFQMLQALPAVRGKRSLRVCRRIRRMQGTKMPL